MFAILLILVVTVSGIWATDYMVILEELYSPCTDGPPESISLDEAFDLSNLDAEIAPDGIHVSGNVTTLWSFPRSDRLSARVNIFHFNRGTWDPTVFSVHTYDLCTAMFDKNTYCYKTLFQNTANPDELRDKCLMTKDAIIVYNPFIMKLQVENIFGPQLHGRYKAVIVIESFEDMNVKRPTSACFEIRGDVEKIKNT
ncbi:uncharacterized protein LOC108089808 [Drosophila ficusphila]|uniref:uncharacterized protein LOC108089808 n=1 Tax=Drosophila ficusphila TaxID=30025 RepID=UPI0007E724F8|nr:uncharacterized protein LOC108089808 [Drosophila ficusphila]